MIVHRAWIAGLATSLAVSMASSLAEPDRARVAALTGRPSQEEHRASTAFAGSVVLERGQGALRTLALVGQGWGMQYRDPELDVSQGIATLGVRAWLTEGVWLQAGVGGARVEASAEAHLDAEPLVIPAAMFGAAVSLGVLELSAHAGRGVDRDGAARVWHASLGLGARF